MTYELAKMLKDAGFPQIRPRSLTKEVNPFSLIYPKEQKWFEGWPMRPAPEHSPNAIHIDDTELKVLVGAYPPSLSELIEACGDELRSVERFGENWAAFRKVEESYQGFTPEEAVARLWLALRRAKSCQKRTDNARHSAN